MNRNRPKKNIEDNGTANRHLPPPPYINFFKTYKIPLKKKFADNFQSVRENGSILKQVYWIVKYTFVKQKNHFNLPQWQNSIVQID